MKKLKWLLDVADKKPLLFSILLLLIAVGVLADMLKERTSRLDACEGEHRVSAEYYDKRVDSIVRFYNQREQDLNAEVKKTLNDIIDNYKTQLEDQKRLNEKITTTIKENKAIINRRNQFP